jgi:hypothetical protein
MAAIQNINSFSKYFRISDSEMAASSALDVVLNADTKLFIDPLLLSASSQPEMRNARKTFTGHFERIIEILSLSKARGDVPWRNAARLLRFHEVGGTCLGYGAGSVRGSGMGSFLSDTLMTTAKEIIDLGVKDPDLFLALALIEEGIGPDRISDMTTNIILKDVIDYTVRVVSDFKMPLRPFRLAGVDARLPENPFFRSMPVLLLPKDVLRSLPIVTDWEGVEDAASHNQELRDRINRDIGELWAAKTRKDKAKLRDVLLSSKDALIALLDAIHSVDKKPYDTELDEDGLVTWIRFIRMATSDFPLDLKKWAGRKLSLSDVKEVVQAITDRFKILVEDKGLWKEFWAGKKNRPEAAAQRLFYAIADSYCKANDIDLTPEASAGNGPVDFKASVGSSKKVLVEIKLSSNSKLLTGYQKQLELYKQAEETAKGIYLVVDVGTLGTKGEKLVAMYNSALEKGLHPSELAFVDAKQRKSASKR